jgi:hypothetical protein
MARRRYTCSEKMCCVGSMSTLLNAMKSLLLKLHFVRVLQFICFKNCWHSTALNCFKKTAQSWEFYDNVFETDRKRLELRALCFTPPPPGPVCLFTPVLSRIKLSDEDNTCIPIINQFVQMSSGLGHIFDFTKASCPVKPKARFWNVCRPLV